MHLGNYKTDDVEVTTWIFKDSLTCNQGVHHHFVYDRERAG